MMLLQPKYLSPPKSASFVAALVILFVLTGLAPGSLRQMSWDFESDPPGRIAEGFTNEVGRWQVVLDGDNHVLAQRAENRDGVFNVTLATNTSYRDLDLSVRMKPVDGENEQGGGLIWRAKDKDNYYVVRYNPYATRHSRRPPNIRLYKVEEGKRTQLDHADAPADNQWHTLRITMIGRDIVGYLDGKKLLEAEDSTFVDVGKIGLWSNSDAQSYFDDLTVSSPRPTEEQK